MSNHEKLATGAAKIAEQGGVYTGTSLGLYQMIIQNQEFIVTMCTIVSVCIGFAGYVTAGCLNFYFKSKHLELAMTQHRRKEDEEENAP